MCGFPEKEIQRNQNDPGADLSGAENDGGWESQIVQEILTGTSGKSPAQCGEKDGKGACDIFMGCKMTLHVRSFLLIGYFRGNAAAFCIIMQNSRKSYEI